jgi:hypothetical protein
VDGVAVTPLLNAIVLPRRCSVRVLGTNLDALASAQHQTGEKREKREDTHFDPRSMSPRERPALV